MQKSVETFKEYAQRLRELVAQVQPPLLDMKLSDMFMDTLQFPCFKKIINSASSTLSILVTIGERIKGGLKSGRIQGSLSMHTIEGEYLSDSQKEVEDEVNAIWETP